MKRDNEPDLATQLLLADIDEVLSNHRATKPMVLTAADRLMVSVLSEAAGEVGTADALRLADSILEATRRHIRQRILHPDGATAIGRA